MPKRPHIIIFNPDEMRADTMGHLGNPAAHTPNLDAFARSEAVSFSNAYCQNPVCVPSRCSFFTGLYPHVHGHRTMSYLLRPGEKNLFSQLRDAGYSVWMNDRNDLCAAQYPGWVESQADTIFSAEGPAAPGPVNPRQRGVPGGKYYYSHFEGELGLDADGRNYSRDDEAVDAAMAGGRRAAVPVPGAFISPPALRGRRALAFRHRPHPAAAAHTVGGLPRQIPHDGTDPPIPKPARVRRTRMG